MTISSPLLTVFTILSTRCTTQQSFAVSTDLMAAVTYTGTQLFVQLAVTPKPLVFNYQT